MWKDWFLQLQMWQRWHETVGNQHEPEPCWKNAECLIRNLPYKACDSIISDIIIPSKLLISLFWTDKIILAWSMHGKLMEDNAHSRSSNSGFFPPSLLKIIDKGFQLSSPFNMAPVKQSKTWKSNWMDAGSYNCDICGEEVCNRGRGRHKCKNKAEGTSLHDVLRQMAQDEAFQSGL